MIDLTGLSVKQLDAVVQSAQQRKEFLQKRPSAARVRAQVVKYVAGYGYSIEELFGSAPSRRTAAARRAPVKRAGTSGKVPAKYRNPANPDETWSGRGRAPRWLAAQLAKGKKIDRFLIKD
ncbi:H-NS family nucleoid-associated regulatory protein [Xanthomonas hortorum]|uniref:H-NS histone family protein n=1 Tax=Xanthomonas hortorum pv. hederae TaxID=453603 RepID=A0A9X3YZ19_9XANT|nr:H-NS histone family protein [Xanthomonas hortorum]MCE4369677.1 H-NS histone family protein [Xanthomonas hortorum pv. hederae]MDC8637175.1 H-NS histone family protein [Xanthomonas hortorum pv. hederae]PPU86217.1 DNA-binding protein [Xanthomonas hortorum pv. hederae]PUF01344.1 H-NS histone family protein [Xanthomonas hortorum pv. hederae]